MTEHHPKSSTRATFLRRSLVSAGAVAAVAPGLAIPPQGRGQILPTPSDLRARAGFLTGDVTSSAGEELGLRVLKNTTDLTLPVDVPIRLDRLTKVLSPAGPTTIAVGDYVIMTISVAGAVLVADAVFVNSVTLNGPVIDLGVGTVTVRDHALGPKVVSLAESGELLDGGIFARTGDRAAGLLPPAAFPTPIVVGYLVDTLCTGRPTAPTLVANQMTFWRPTESPIPAHSG